MRASNIGELARLARIQSAAATAMAPVFGAIAAGDELGKLLESLYTEEISPAALEKIVPEAFAEHWRHSLEFLTIVTHAWPSYLREQGLMDPAERRVKLIDRQTEHWKKTPPQTPMSSPGSWCR